MDTSLRILVVEREVHSREGLRSILSSDGHVVSVAEDIWAGFARVTLQPFDLLLVDDDVRGIVLSSFEDDVARYRREDGMLAVLEKPMEVCQLRSELEALTARRADA
jgi:DNA-binding NtrC family response regulator